MSNLGGLIQGQDVAFDTHQAGEPNVHWEDLHLEKRLHSGGKARYPMFGDRRPSSSGMNDDKFNRITKEVKRALKKNPRLTNDLAQTIAKQLQRFRSNEATEEQAKEAARKIAGYFDLEEKFVDSVARYSNEILKEFVSLHQSISSNEFKEVRLSDRAIVVRDARKYYRAKYERKQ